MQAPIGGAREGPDKVRTTRLGQARAEDLLRLRGLRLRALQHAHAARGLRRVGPLAGQAEGARRVLGP